MWIKPAFLLGKSVLEETLGPFKNAIVKFAFWAASRKQRKIACTPSLCIVVYDDAVCAMFPCFLGPNQISILKIAILNAGLF